MSHPRHLLKQKVKDFNGIFLEAIGTLDNAGILKTPFTSAQIKADTIVFSGHHQSGFLKDNRTWVTARQVSYRGQVNAPQGIYFDIKEQLTLGGRCKLTS